MKIRDFKITVCLAFLFIFFTKMVLSVAPVFIELDTKTVNAVIMQLEIGHNDSKDSETSKDSSIKDKKSAEAEVLNMFMFSPERNLTSISLRFKKFLYFEVYHSSVPTPPPNA